MGRLSPSRGVRRRHASMILVAAVVLLVLGGALVGPGEPARLPAPEAVAPTEPGPVVPTVLQRPIVDLALLPPRIPDAPPRMLTLARESQDRQTVRLAVLDRAAGAWTVGFEIEVPAGARGSAGSPWLIPLGSARFALIETVEDLGETWLRTVAWVDDKVRVGPPRIVRRVVSDAAAADVDGVAGDELILVEAGTRASTAQCRGSVVLVVDGATLDVRAEHTLPGQRLVSAALADLDASPGRDLVASAVPACPREGRAAGGSAIAALRLVDGAVLAVRELAGAQDAKAGTLRVHVADLDDDGRPEVLLGSTEGLVVVSPDRGWTLESLADLPGRLVGVQAGTAVAMDRAAIRSAAIGRSGAGWATVPGGSLSREDLGENAWRAAELDASNAWRGARGQLSWLRTPPGGGCPTLVVPLAVVGCNGEALAAGPAWFAARPIVALDGQSVLVARSDTWLAAPSRLTGPAPLATSTSHPAWRHGASTAFTLTEVDAASVAGQGRPSVSIASGAHADRPAALLRAPAAARVVVATSAVPAPGDRPVADLVGLLERGADAAVDLGLHPPDEPEPLFDGTFRLPLPPRVDPGHAAPQWHVTAAAISEVGDVSPVTRAVVAIDDVAPSVIVEVPFVLPPWPFTASIRGTTEAGSTVTTPDGTTLPVAPDGTFDLARRLAPWPQRLELVARDAVGNETAVRVDVVGGPDYRRLPWPMIVLVTLVGAAAFGGRARRGVARASTAPDGMNVLEELDPAQGAARPSGDGR